MVYRVGNLPHEEWRDFTEKGAPADDSSCGFALKRQDIQAYNEEAFRYFLDLERRRAELSRRPLILLLVDLKRQPGVSTRVESGVAARLFSGLQQSLRDTDFVGWYSDGRVAGAVLTQPADVSGADAIGRVTPRVTAALRARLPRRVVRRLQVRVYQLPPCGDR
jgi:hypothetical protein